MSCTVGTDIVIASQHDRYTSAHEFGSMCDQTCEPGQLVIELRTGLRIAVREIDRSDQDSIYGRLDVACLAIIRIARQACAGQHRIAVSREDRHSVPGTLALPDSTIAEGSKGLRGKCVLLGLEFLETNDIGLGFGEPSHEVLQPLVDIIY